MMKLLNKLYLVFLLALISTEVIFAQKQDMNVYLRETTRLVKQEKYAEALERYVWFHNNTLEFQKPKDLVLSSFALLKALGEVYPPAMEKLIDTRDEKTKELIDNGGTSQLFLDVKSINRIIKEDIKTLDLFETILAKYPEKAQSYWHNVESDFFTAKRYHTIQKFIGNPIREYTVILEIYRIGIDRLKTTTGNKALLKVAIENQFVRQSLRLIDFATALNDIKSAKKIQKSASKVVADYRLDNALSNKDK